MLAPIPPILEEALERVCEKEDLTHFPPLISELAETAQQILTEKRYSGDTNSDFRAALDVRLGSLTRGSIGRVFQSRFSIPSVEHLMKSYTLIELEPLSPDNASLLTLFLLTALREHLITTPRETHKTRLVIIIEEAHNLVGRTGPARASEEIADPKAFAAEAICRMLMEFRALGVGVLIVDQHSTAVAPEVIKASTTKVAFRQVDEPDRQDMGATMLFGPLEMEEIARLRTGEAYFYTEGLHGPRRIKTVDLHASLDMSKVVLREKLLPFIISDAWFLEASKERIITELNQLKEIMDAYDQKWLNFTNGLSALLQLHAQIESFGNNGRKESLRSLSKDAVSLRKSMIGEFRTFKSGPYRNLLVESNTAGLSEDIEYFRNILIERFEMPIQAGFFKGLELLDNLISHCNC